MSRLTNNQRTTLISNLKLAFKEQLEHIKEYIRICETEGLTDEQFFIEYEMELSKLATLDHNKGIDNN